MGLIDHTITVKDFRKAVKSAIKKAAQLTKEFTWQLSSYILTL